MSDIHYIDRTTKKEEKEKVYGQFFIELLYGKGFISQFLSFVILPIVAKIPFFSRIYGSFQRSKVSKAKVQPFIQAFHVDASEFLDPPSSFQSFNDFFIRKLKPECRPIANGNDVAVLPADARYLVFADIHATDGFFVKGKKFSLDDLLQNADLAHKYAHGGMVLARLCPVDYHRFHFPCNCVPDEAKLINGPLYSVNPIALKKNFRILSENKRVITPLHTKNFGTVLYIEVGATYVGSIRQTFVAHEHYAKGDEKGYFSFGGSCVILLFEPFRIQFDQDLLEASSRHIEVKGKLGQSMGRALSPL
jgi:phosphatidylserine decarboxylase